jgi:lysozyme
MILGVDVSFWQQKVNWKTMREKGVKFAIIRAGQGKDKDSRFDENWKGAADNGIKRGAYWFYEWRSGRDPGARYQASILADILKGDHGELGAACDFESPGSAWPMLPSSEICNNLLWDFYETLRNNGVRSELFYSNLDGIKHINPQPWLKQKKLWLAWYPIRFNALKLRWDHETWLAYHLKTGIIPTLPNTNWGSAPLFWQFTYFLDGINYGVQSKELDGNYFFGDNTEDEEVKIILVSKGNQNLRPSPSLTSIPIRLLSAGETMSVDDLISDTRGVWVYDKAKGYAAVYYDGKQYMTRG